VLLFGGNRADDADVGVATERVLEKMGEFGVTVWDVRSGQSVLVLV
jgi:hypothetical protein